MFAFSLNAWLAAESVCASCDRRGDRGALPKHRFNNNKSTVCAIMAELIAKQPDGELGDLEHSGARTGLHPLLRGERLTFTLPTHSGLGAGVKTDVGPRIIPPPHVTTAPLGVM